MNNTPEKTRQKLTKEEKYKRRRAYLDEYYSRPGVKEKIALKAKKYTSDPNIKNKIKIYQKDYKSKPKIKKIISEKGKEYRSRPEVKERIKICRKNQIITPKSKENKKLYYQNNKEKIQLKNKENHKKRLKNDPSYKLLCSIRHRIKETIKRGYKSASSKHLLGCAVEKARNHIESQFKEGMTWENHGKFGWHIDHIKPCASFDLTDPEQQRQCFHYTNLQPLWWRDNLSKGEKIL